MEPQRKSVWGWPAHRIGTSINLLILLSIVVFAAAFTMFGGLQERQRALRAQARESVVWAVFQGRVEVKDFIEALVLATTDPQTEALAEVLTRYDVLYSRAAFLQEGTYVLHASQFEDIQAISGALHAAIRSRATRAGCARCCPSCWRQPGRSTGRSAGWSPPPRSAATPPRWPTATRSATSTGAARWRWWRWWR
jgi:hypothetical protein